MEETRQNVETVEEEATDQAESEKTEQQEESKEQTKSYSEDEVKELVQKSITDFQKQQEAKLEEERKVAKMNAEERQKHEQAKRDERIKELESQLATRDNRRLVSELAESQEVNITQKDVDFLVTASEEETQQKANYFIERIKQAYSDGKDSTIKSSAPKLTAEKNSKTMTKEDILAIKDPEERNRLMTKNYNLFI